MGSPAREIKVAQRMGVHLHNLPEYAKKISELEEEINKLKEKFK